MAHKMRIRRDDTVQVITGKDSGKTGRVIRVEPKKSRVFVEGVNVQKRHSKPRSLRDVQKQGQMGGIIEAEGPIHVSNVKLLDPSTDKPTRVNVVREGGVRRRVAKVSGERVD